MLWGVGLDNTYGRNMARGNTGVQAACPWAGIGNPPTTDFCDATGGANVSPLNQPGLLGGDNLMPNLL